MPTPKELFKMLIKNYVDDLSKFNLICLLIFFVLSIFTTNFIIDITTILFFILIPYRIFSKNKIARYKENEVFVKIKNKICHPFKATKKYFSDRKNNVLKKCPKCKTVVKLPLPKKAGINHAKCPNCGKRLTIINIRTKKKEQIKVEVIKKKK